MPHLFVHPRDRGTGSQEKSGKGVTMVVIAATVQSSDLQESEVMQIKGLTRSRQPPSSFQKMDFGSSAVSSHNPASAQRPPRRKPMHDIFRRQPQFQYPLEFRGTVGVPARLYPRFRVVAGTHERGIPVGFVILVELECIVAPASQRRRHGETRVLALALPADDRGE